jgi:hypothetical protein
MPCASGVPSIPVATQSGQVEPVACSSHPDLAPRGAVRRVGPRPDPNRSARTDEPGGPASRPGDRKLRLWFAIPDGNQPPEADGKKNGARSYPEGIRLLLCISTERATLADPIKPFGTAQRKTPKGGQKERSSREGHAD